MAYQSIFCQSSCWYCCLFSLYANSFQTLAALVLSIFFRANIPVAFVGIWINNPFTMLPMYYLAYTVGKDVLHIPQQPHFQSSFLWFWHNLNHIWQPFLLGSLICGIVLGLATYLTVNYGCKLYDMLTPREV